jgi:site-specific DNA-methyltransferase (adenine-specific)
MSTLIQSLHEPALGDWADNEPGAIEKLHELNEFYRRNRWPVEYSKTVHTLRRGDARDLSFIPDESVHLVVTSPPIGLSKNIPHTRTN